MTRHNADLICNVLKDQGYVCRVYDLPPLTQPLEWNFGVLVTGLIIREQTMHCWTDEEYTRAQEIHDMLLKNIANEEK